VMCYCPHLIWKSLEGGCLSSLTMNAQGRVPNEAARAEISDTIAAYVTLTTGSHDWRAAAFAVSEMLAIANIIIQMFFLDNFFSGTFSGLGTDAVLSVFYDAGRTQSMMETFPRYATTLIFCNFRIYHFHSQVGQMCLVRVLACCHRRPSSALRTLPPYSKPSE
jgi:hypothetical protein